MGEQDLQVEQAFVSLDDNAGPALPQSGMQAEALARAAVRQCRPRTPPVRLARRPAFWGVAAGMLFLGGAALAAVRVWPSPFRAHQQVGAPARAAGRLELDSHGPVGPDQPAAPASPSAPPPQASSPQESSPQSVVAHAVGPVVELDSGNGGSLLARANRARGRGRLAVALGLYRKAAKSKDRETSTVALVAQAALTLEQAQQPQRAVRLYRRALAKGAAGALAAVARYGVAQGLRAQGDRPGEARALSEFLLHHPNHMLANRSTRRLADLH